MTVFEILRKSITSEVLRVQNSLGSGSAKSYDEYQKLCGVIKGLHIALSDVEDLERKAEGEYEDDENEEGA
jgi:hypothetical protein